jgi:hypothetical protein
LRNSDLAWDSVWTTPDRSKSMGGGQEGPAEIRLALHHDEVHLPGPRVNPPYDYNL